MPDANPDDLGEAVARPIGPTETAHISTYTSASQEFVLLDGDDDNQVPEVTHSAVLRSAHLPDGMEVDDAPLKTSVPLLPIVDLEPSKPKRKKKKVRRDEIDDIFAGIF